MMAVAAYLKPPQSPHSITDSVSQEMNVFLRVCFSKRFPFVYDTTLVLIRCQSLFKVLHATLKDLHILLAVDVDCDCIAAALRVCHLAKDSSVGAGDTLDRHVGAVDIPLLVHGGIAGLVDVLGNDLSVLKEPIQPLLRCDETSLSVGSGIRVYTAECCTCHPG